MGSIGANKTAPSAVRQELDRGIKEIQQGTTTARSVVENMLQAARNNLPVEQRSEFKFVNGKYVTRNTVQAGSAEHNELSDYLQRQGYTLKPNDIKSTLEIFRKRGSKPVTIKVSRRRNS